MSPIVTDIAQGLEIARAIFPPISVVLHVMQLKGPRILLAPLLARPSARATSESIAIENLPADVVRNVPVVGRRLIRVLKCVFRSNPATHSG